MKDGKPRSSVVYFNDPLDVKCPECGAPPGELCRYKRIPEIPHIARESVSALPH